MAGSSKKRAIASAGLIALFIAVVVGLSYLAFMQFVFQAPDQQPDASPAVADATVEDAQENLQPRAELTTVTAARGEVHRRYGEKWAPLVAGDELGPEETVRTGPGSEADLKIGSKSTMTVAEKSQLSVKEVTAAARRFTLRRGRVAVDYQDEGQRHLRIEDEAGKTIASARAARFHVLKTENTFVVATDTGKVNLSSAGTTTSVTAGTQSLVTGKNPPSPPRPIPKALLLKVAAAKTQRKKLCAVIRGKADPSSQVQVDGKAVELTASGGFTVQVARRPGLKHVVVQIRDATGRSKEQLVACRSNKQTTVEGMGVRWRAHNKSK